MGGMAAQIPIKNDPAANSAALAKVGLRTVRLRMWSFGLCTDDYRTPPRGVKAPVTLLLKVGWLPKRSAAFQERGFLQLAGERNSCRCAFLPLRVLCCT